MRFLNKKESSYVSIKPVDRNVLSHTLLEIDLVKPSLHRDEFYYFAAFALSNG